MDTIDADGLSSAVMDDAPRSAESSTHRLISAHRCTCGWEGDSAVTHIIDTLGIEQVGWISYQGFPGHSEPGQGFLHNHMPAVFGGAGPSHGICEPVYRLSRSDGTGGAGPL